MCRHIQRSNCKVPISTNFKCCRLYVGFGDALCDDVVNPCSAFQIFIKSSVMYYSLVLVFISTVISFCAMMTLEMHMQPT